MQTCALYDVLEWIGVMNEKRVGAILEKRMGMMLVVMMGLGIGKMCIPIIMFIPLSEDKQATFSGRGYTKRTLLRICCVTQKCTRHTLIYN